MKTFLDMYQKAKPKDGITPIMLMKWIAKQEELQEWDELGISHDKYLTSFIPLFAKRCFDREIFSKKVGITYGSLRVFLTQEAVQKLHDKHIRDYSQHFCNAIQYSDDTSLLDEWNDYYSRKLKINILSKIRERAEFLKQDVVNDILTRNFIKNMDAAISFMLPRVNKPDDVRVLLSGRVQIIAEGVQELGKTPMSSEAQNKLNAVAEQVQRLREELGMVWHETQKDEE